MRWIAALPLILAVGCASTPSPAPQANVTPATPEQVASCTYLDDVIGTSGYYGVFASKGADNARAELMEKAAALGATHIVWSRTDAQYGGTSSQAKAYRCP